MYEYTVKGCPNVRSYECLAHELMIEPNFAATRKQQSFVGSGGQSAKELSVSRYTCEDYTERTKLKIYLAVNF